MAAISQTTLSNSFSWMKMSEFRLKFHWNSFHRVQLTIFQYWFRWWLGAVQATSHYLKQWWLVHRRIYASLGLNELNRISFVIIPDIEEGFSTPVHVVIISYEALVPWWLLMLNIVHMIIKAACLLAPRRIANKRCQSGLNPRENVRFFQGLNPWYADLIYFLKENINIYEHDTSFLHTEMSRVDNPFPCGQQGCT